MITSATRRYLHIGGLIAAGFDPSGEYLLEITHSGGGVFSTRTWERLACNSESAYLEGGIGWAISPVKGQAVPVTVLNYATGEKRVVGPCGRFVLE